MTDPYPLSPESLAPALRVACRGLTRRRELDNVTTALRDAAPHIGAAALLDYADYLCPVGESNPDAGFALRLRERASSLVRWDVN